MVFLVFNDFSTGQNTDGHKYSGFANGAPCEASQASGYTVVSYKDLLRKIRTRTVVTLLLFTTFFMNKSLPIHGSVRL